jgi:serine phosphatase RsbU (regulator of sigma subunit)
MQYEYQVESLQDSLQFSKEREVQKVKLKQQETQSFALLSGLLLSILAMAIGLRSFIRKKKDNEKINAQKEEVEVQKRKIELQHLKLTNTHREISDSINYAKRIQAAILPTKEALAQVLVKEFVIFEPKDIVSGDFYWLEETENEIFIAVADCTGHGVPGAMVSVVCHNALNRAVREFNLSKPAEILDKTKELVIETFKSKSEFVRDGMDISFCKLTKDTHKIEWAGANNPLYIFRKGGKAVEIIPPNKQSVGVSDHGEKFNNHQIELKDGDRIYLFTDGYVDQFGGEKGKKFKHARLRDLIVKYSSTAIYDQKDIFLKEFHDWKRELEQIDDVCVIGIELE